MAATKKNALIAERKNAIVNWNTYVSEVAKNPKNRKIEIEKIEINRLLDLTEGYSPSDITKSTIAILNTLLARGQFKEIGTYPLLNNPTDIDGKEVIRREKIDTVVGLRYLLSMGINRNIKWTNISELMPSMQRRGWARTHEAIAFDSKGRLFDGQNRIISLILGNIVSTNALVAYGAVDDDARDLVDVNQSSRKPVDSRPYTHDEKLPPKVFEYANALETGVAHGSHPGKYVNWIVDNHYEALLWVEKETCGHKAKYRSAGIGAALTGAYENNVNLDRLAEFIQVLGKGKVIRGVEDNAAIELKNWLDNKSIQNGKDRTMIFRKTELAIKHFLDGKNISYLSIPKKRQYPVQHVSFAEWEQITLCNDEVT